MSLIEEVLYKIQLDIPNITLETESQYKPFLPTTPTQIAGMIDHTFLKPTATVSDIERVCTEAKEHSFATVCVNSRWISYVQESLVGYTAKPIVVVGFPLGAMSTEMKAQEALWAVQHGAEEVDMVVSIGELKDKQYQSVYDDIVAVVNSAKCPVKVILETCLLTKQEIIAGSIIAKNAGAAFVKTSTGFNSGGATEVDVRLMRDVVGNSMGVKASGGVRSIADLLTMVRAGANRIGASSGVAILSGATTDTHY